MTLFEQLQLPHSAHSPRSHFRGAAKARSCACPSSRDITPPSQQVLVTEFMATRAKKGGDGRAFVSGMALLAAAAAASAADASGFACR